MNTGERLTQIFIIKTVINIEIMAYWEMRKQKQIEDKGSSIN